MIPVRFSFVTKQNNKHFIVIIMNKNLVAYFFARGVTEKAARCLAKAVDADWLRFAQ